MNKKILSFLILFFSVGIIFASGNKETTETVEKSSYLTFTDYRDREIVLDSEPLRVVSLAPNVTETIFAIGAESKLVGRTDYCDYPTAVSEIESIGTLLEPSVEKIVSLNPDLIIASTHFSEELLTKLTDISLKVAIIDEKGSIEGTYENITDIGLLLNREDEAKRVVSDIKAEMARLKDLVKDSERPSVYYVVGYGEYGDYTAGGDTFISGLLEIAGGDNIAKDSLGWGYSLEKIIEKNPEIIICSKYYGTKEGIASATGYKELPAVKNNKLIEIDNNLVDRQGPRIAEGVKELMMAIHPELF